MSEGVKQVNFEDIMDELRSEYKFLVKKWNRNKLARQRCKESGGNAENMKNLMLYRGHLINRIRAFHEKASRLFHIPEQG